MLEPKSLNLSSTYVRLRNDALAEPLPVTGDFWQRLMNGQLGTFHNEYLVTTHAFDADWGVWEMHPHGDEVVCLLSGSVTFVLEMEDKESTIELSEAGSFVIVPKGTWHTARVSAPSRVLFITAGEGTQNREIVP